MNRSNLVFVVLLLVAIGVGWVLTSPGSPGNETSTDGNGDIPPDRPVYYYFYSNSCPACTRMERTTHSNSSVIEILEANFTFIKVNTVEDKQLTQEYNIYYIPDNIFTYPDGQIIYRSAGAIDPEMFVNLLNEVADFFARNG
jgi:thiol:disulfide interchange protein DsbD